MGSYMQTIMGTRYEAKYLVDYVEEIMNNPKNDI